MPGNVSRKFFHIFGSLCYIIEMGENIDKMKGKRRCMYFCWVFYSVKAYRVFNKRTKMIVETMHGLPLRIASNGVQISQFDPVHNVHTTVYRLKKALYGLKQAPRAWYDELSNFLVSNGFSKGSIDPTLFITKHGEDMLLVQIYVDDIIFGSDDLKLSKRFGKDTVSKLTAFSDSDHAGCLDSHKSTSGGIQFLGGDKLVSWSSKKSDCTSMSLAKAKYVSLSACCAQVLWLRTQLTDYGFHFDKIPMYCDSKAAIAISCNPVHHSYTKHIDVRYHFIKGQIKSLVRTTRYEMFDSDELDGSGN
ncbi:retrovirus-related pol polyprotein from transposon TNT 1-94 [Tanacetum coccineum]